MSKRNQKLVTPAILRQAVIGSFTKLNPVYMMKNPVMFVVEIGFFITLVLSFFPGLFGDVGSGTNLRAYNMIVCAVLFVTVLFANFAESVAEGRGKAQAASLKKTQKDTQARLLLEDGTEKTVLSSELKKGDVVMVKAGEIIPGDGEVIEGIASVDESAITGESAPVVRESGGDFCSVTGGTTIVSDWLKIRITSDPGSSFLDRMPFLKVNTMLPSAFTAAFSTSAFQSWGVKPAMGAWVVFSVFRKPVKALRCILRLSHSASLPFSLFSSSANLSVIL